MKFIKQGSRIRPKVSLILLDWSVRESFHLLHYLSEQTVNRDDFEVIFVEYYSRQAEPLKQFAGQIDTWVLLEMPESCVYHKHLMYNCGIVFCHGEIVVLCDSDAMVRDSFIQTIIDEFEKNGRIVLHLDQFRNHRRDFYPFNYPSFEEVLGEGCINNIGGKTEGILDPVDPLHSRNYGACMCARRADLIAIGGADEHIDYLGHICGPYEMTFRLINCGFKETWHDTEFLYHTWHPGQAGVDNYQGPHDGRQMSSTGLEALITKRIQPLVENRAMRLLRTGERLGDKRIGDYLIDECRRRDWDQVVIGERQARERKSRETGFTDLYRGYKVTNDNGRWYAWTLMDTGHQEPGGNVGQVIFEGVSVDDLIQKIEEGYPTLLRVSERVNAAYSSLCLMIWLVAAPVRGILRALYRKYGEWGSNRQPMASSFEVGSQSLFGAFRRSWQRYAVGWLAARQYRVYMDRCANHLIANLYFARREAVLDSSGNSPVLLTTSLFIRLYLKALMAARILPTVKIKWLRNSTKAKQYFDTLSQEKKPKRLLVGRDIYSGYYGSIQGCRNLKQALLF